MLLVLPSMPNIRSMLIPMDGGTESPQGEGLMFYTLGGRHSSASGLTVPAVFVSVVLCRKEH